MSHEEQSQLLDRLGRLERAEEQRDVFVHLARRLAGATAADAVMNAAQEASERLLGWDFFYLAYRLPGSDHFRLAGVVDTIDGRKTSFPPSQDTEAAFSPALRGVLAGTPALFNRREGEATPLLNPLGSERLAASLLYVPVRCEGCAIGLVSAQSYTPSRYGQSDLRLLQDIADAVAPAIERIRAEESLRSSQQLLRIERDLAISLSAARDLDETFDHLLETSLHLDGIDCGGAYLVDPMTRAHSLVCYRNLSARFADHVRHVARDSRPAAAASMGRPVYLATPELHAADAAIRDEALLSLAIVPVAYEGNLIAVLNLASRRFNEIPHHSRHAIEAIAAQMGATLIRICAEQALRETRDQLEQRVRDRTAELLDANLHLQAEVLERQRAEEALLRKERELRLLGVQANRRLEEERARVSRELHDELGQILTALNLNLNWLGRRIGDVGSDIVERIDESAQHVSRMLASVRTLSRSLRPAALSHEGLAEAVRSHVAEFEQYAGISCKVEIVPPNLEVSEPLATTAFRIVQEALTNVARHSKATRCRIGVAAVDDMLVLEIRDNGIGLQEGDQAVSVSLGIPGMRERAEMIGGSLVVANNPEAGVCVTAHLPRNGQD